MENLVLALATKKHSQKCTILYCSTDKKQAKVGVE